MIDKIDFNIDYDKDISIELVDSEDESQGLIYKSDNLNAMLDLINKGESVDLVYADPTYATGRVFTIEDGEVNQFDENGDVAYEDKIDGKDYLQDLTYRLILCRELLSDKGSIYVHIGNKMQPYVRVIMDKVFGIENHLNTITRVKCNPKNFDSKNYGNQTDKILYYAKNKGEQIWNNPKKDYTEEQLDRLFPREDDDGRRFCTSPLHAPGETKDGVTGNTWKNVNPPSGRHWAYKPSVLDEMDEKGEIYWSKNGNPREKKYAEKQDGFKRQDVWEFKDPQDKKYPTEKNKGLLDLIISASSTENSTVLDPYMGGGTTLVSAYENNRFFIGIDKSEKAIDVTEQRFDCSFDYFVENN